MAATTTTTSSYEVLKEKNKLTVTKLRWARALGKTNITETFDNKDNNIYASNAHVIVPINIIQGIQEALAAAAKLAATTTTTNAASSSQPAAAINNVVEKLQEKLQENNLKGLVEALIPLYYDRNPIINVGGGRRKPVQAKRHASVMAAAIVAAAVPSRKTRSRKTKPSP